MRAAAQDFEAAFLAEMLKHAGLNALPSAFGGGAGEDAFSSLLTAEYARLLAEAGGVGIAEQVFEMLKQRTDSP
jgi:peptidoglycan hydrolase FlgJ